MASMRPAAENLHFWKRHHGVSIAQEMDVKGIVFGGRRRVQHGHRHGHQCITSQPRLVCGAVKFDQNLIDLCLAACVAAKKRTGNFSVDMAHSARHPKSAEAGIAVTQIDGFATAFGGA